MFLGPRHKPPKNPERVYTVLSIESTERADLPWKVTIEGCGFTSTYSTQGTRPEVEEKAERACLAMNQHVSWIRTVHTKIDKAPQGE